jgi:hypothetical protein
VIRRFGHCSSEESARPGGWCRRRASVKIVARGSWTRSLVCDV